MARPVKSRDAASFSLDVARITRLRTSLVCDSRLDKEAVARALHHIDRLVDELVFFAQEDLIIPSGADMNVQNRKSG